MPELPEVETIRRQLAPRVEGRRIERLAIHDPRWCSRSRPPRWSTRSRAGEIEALRRRGKYFDFALTDDVHLLVAPAHDRQRCSYDRRAGPAARPRARSASTTAARWRSNDPRRFGTGELALGPRGPRRVLRGAPRASSRSATRFTADALRALARGCRAPVKAMLLDQKRIAGVGNIYADEALFRARIHPLREADRLNRPQTAALRDAVVESLQAGIAYGGATIDDYRDPDGGRGGFQDRVPRPPPRRRAMPALRRADRQAGRRRARHLRLPALPAAAPSEAHATLRGPCRAR